MCNSLPPQLKAEGVGAPFGYPSDYGKLSDGGMYGAGDYARLLSPAQDYSKLLGPMGYHSFMQVVPAPSPHIAFLLPPHFVV